MTLENFREYFRFSKETDKKINKINKYLDIDNYYLINSECKNNKKCDLQYAIVYLEESDCCCFDMEVCQEGKVYMNFYISDEDFFSDNYLEKAKESYENQLKLLKYKTFDV